MNKTSCKYNSSIIFLKLTVYKYLPHKDRITGNHTGDTQAPRSLVLYIHLLVQILASILRLLRSGIDLPEIGITPGFHYRNFRFVRTGCTTELKSKGWLDLQY